MSSQYSIINKSINQKYLTICYFISDYQILCNYTFFLFISYLRIPYDYFYVEKEEDTRLKSVIQDRMGNQVFFRGGQWQVHLPYMP